MSRKKSDAASNIYDAAGLLRSVTHQIPRHNLYIREIIYYETENYL